MTYLLDTSVLIDALNDRRGRADLLEELLLQDHSLGCCSVNVTEVFAGMRAAEQSRTEELLNGLDYYEVTWAVARHAGLLRRDWARKGITLSVSDVTIAAVALANSLVLITDNVKYYPMRDLQLYRLP